MTKLLATSAALLVALATSASAMFTLESTEDVAKFLDHYGIEGFDPAEVTDHQKVALSTIEVGADVSRVQIRNEALAILNSDK